MTHINAIGSRRLISMISVTFLSALPDDAVTLISLFSRLVAGRVVLSLPSSAVTFSDFLDKDLLSGLLYQVSAREDNGDREGIPRTHPIP